MLVSLVEQQDVVDGGLRVHTDAERIIGNALIAPRVGQVRVGKTRTANDCTGRRVAHSVRRAVEVRQEWDSLVSGRLPGNAVPEVPFPIPCGVECVHRSRDADGIAVGGTVVAQFGRAHVEVGVAGAEGE